MAGSGLPMTSGLTPVAARDGVDHGSGAGPEPVGRGVARVRVGRHEPGARPDRRRRRREACLVKVEVHAHEDRVDARCG